MAFGQTHLSNSLKTMSLEKNAEFAIALRHDIRLSTSRLSRTTVYQLPILPLLAATETASSQRSRGMRAHLMWSALFTWSSEKAAGA